MPLWYFRHSHYQLKVDPQAYHASQTKCFAFYVIFSLEEPDATDLWRNGNRVYDDHDVVRWGFSSRSSAGARSKSIHGTNQSPGFHNDFDPPGNPEPIPGCVITMAAQTAGKVCSHHQKIKPSLQVKKDDIAFPLALGRNFLLHPFSPTHEGHPLERPLTSIRWNPAESHLLKKNTSICVWQNTCFSSFQ